MNIINNMKILPLSMIFLIPSWSQADILIEVSATLLEPTCNIRSENNNSPLKINFGTLNPELISTTEVIRDFSIYIFGCNIDRNLDIVINPKVNGSIVYKGINILGTNISGLGIDLKQTNAGTIRDLEVNKRQRIYPTKLSTSETRLDLRAQLVSAVPINELDLGRFGTSATFTVTYN